MKYLKLFEDNDFYHLVTRSSYLINKAVKFTDGESSKLNELGFFTSNVIKYGYSNRNRDYYIFSLGDEWYIVLVQNSNISVNEFGKTYKCDQWDGLIKCLKNKGAI